MHHEARVTAARTSAPHLRGNARCSTRADRSRTLSKAPFADSQASGTQASLRAGSNAASADVAASVQPGLRVQSKRVFADVTVGGAWPYGRSLTLLALCALALGCAGSNAGSQAGPAASTAGASGMSSAAAGASAVVSAGSAGAQPSAAGASAAGKLSFANDVFPKVIRGKCGACHNDAPSFGGLAFFPGGPEFAYMNLVSMPSGNQEGFKCKDSGLMRVQPGDPEHSLMYLKLTTPPCGSKMPPGAFGTTTPEQVELVRQWIADGAAP